MRGAAVISVGNRHHNDNSNDGRLDNDSYAGMSSRVGRGGFHHRGGGGGGGGRWQQHGNGRGTATTTTATAASGRGRSSTNSHNNIVMRDSSRRNGSRAGVGGVDEDHYDNISTTHYRANANANDHAAAPAPNTEPALRVLSFYEHGSRIAFAFYSEDENEIVYEDAIANTGEETERIVQGVLLETRPNLILVGNKVVANAPLLECLTTMPTTSMAMMENVDGITAPPPRNSSAGQPVTSISIPYQLLKSSAFEPRQCRSAILHKLRVLTLMRHIHHPYYRTNFTWM